MPELLANIGDIVLDAFKDTLTLIPFLYLTYLAMEALEHSAAGFSERVVARAGKAGPVLGGLLGALPQCGFSAMAATLYAGRVVTMGTVIAVFLSTSDEMLPVFISEGAPIETILAIIGTKVLIGMVAGIVIDFVMHLLFRGRRESLRIADLCAKDGCDCEPVEKECSPTHCSARRAHHDHANHDHAHHDRAHHDHAHSSIWKSALIHTVQVTVFIFLISLVLDALITFVGEEALATFMNQNATLSIFASALVGLIPNCAASVAISDLYLQGALAAPAMMAGLLVGAGVGLLVLFRANRPMSNNFVILALLYAIGTAVGLGMQALGIVF